MTRPRRRSLAAVMAVVLAFSGYSLIREDGESRAVEDQPAGATLKGASDSGEKDESPSKGSTAKGKRKTENRGPLPPAKDISFKAPIDFETRAVPSSAVFNAAAGDQLALTLIHATLSDSLAVGDFNRDGDPDVAQTNVIAGTVSVFLGDGLGGFKLLDPIPVGVHPNFVVAVKLDPEGYLDLVVANTDSDNLTILRGEGDGKFQPASFVTVPSPRNVAVGNFNGDDIPDLAVASGTAGEKYPAGGVAILAGHRLADGVVTFVLTQFIRLTHSGNGQPVGANYVAVGDFDTSGFDDLAVGVGNNANAGDQQADGTKTGDDLLIVLNHNEPTLQPFDTLPSQPAIRVGAAPDAIAVADLNGDSHPDLAVLDSRSSDIATLLGDGQGRFAVRATNVTLGYVPRSLAVGDFNDDGIPDLATASFGSSTVSVLQGIGDGALQPAVDFWAGDEPSSVAVGDFDDDGRLDVVAARLRTDQLSLLLNDSPQRGDGVVIKRDIPYIDPAGDPLAAHHTLDVYIPPKGRVSFAGKGQPYPVVFFAHGGGGIACAKSVASYLMRSLAVDGIVAVSTSYRLGSNMAEDQARDVAQAFRWTRDNIGSEEYGGDPHNLFTFGHSGGGAVVARLATDPISYGDVRKSTRGFVVAGAPPPVERASRDQPPSLLLNGTEGLEIALIATELAFAEASSAAGAESKHVVVLGRDHFTLLSNMALPGDEGRVHILDFMQKQLMLH